MTGDSEREGAVFWITGLSGSGKTTLGALLFHRIRVRHPNSVFLDGDQLRPAVAEDLGYSTEDRLRCARRYGRLAKLLAEQGCNVVVATVSMFSESRSWNRRHIPRYCEVYLKAPLSVLRERNQGGLYDESRTGETVGLDLPFEEPRRPDLVLPGDGSKTPEDQLEILWEGVQPWL